jgi:hypothetical protein
VWRATGRLRRRPSLEGEEVEQSGEEGARETEAERQMQRQMQMQRQRQRQRQTPVPWLKKRSALLCEPRAPMKERAERWTSTPTPERGRAREKLLEEVKVNERGKGKTGDCAPASERAESRRVARIECAPRQRQRTAK